MENESKLDKEPIPRKQSFLTGFREVGTLIRMKWPVYLVEIVVIIIGITISFTFDNYKEKFSKAALEQSYLHALHKDIKSDTAKLARIIQASHDIIDNARELLKSGAALRTKKPAPDDVSKQFSAILLTPDFISTDATFNDLRSGNVHLLRNERLRNLLFEYYSYTANIKVIETIERDRVIALYQPFLYKHFYMKGYETNQPRIMPNGDNFAILADTTFGNIVSSRIHQRLEIIEYYQKELNLANELRNLLELEAK